jgi:hypothetical protein
MYEPLRFNAANTYQRFRLYLFFFINFCESHQIMYGSIFSSIHFLEELIFLYHTG